MAKVNGETQNGIRYIAHIETDMERKYYLKVFTEPGKFPNHLMDNIGRVEGLTPNQLNEQNRYLTRSNWKNHRRGQK